MSILANVVDPAPQHEQEGSRTLWVLLALVAGAQLVAFWLVCSHQVRKAEARHNEVLVQQMALSDCLQYIPGSTIASCASQMGLAATAAGTPPTGNPALSAAVLVGREGQPTTERPLLNPLHVADAQAAAGGSCLGMSDEADHAEHPPRYCPTELLASFALLMAGHGRCVSTDMMLGDPTGRATAGRRARRGRRCGSWPRSARLVAYFEDRCVLAMRRAPPRSDSPRTP